MLREVRCKPSKVPGLRIIASRLILPSDGLMRPSLSFPWHVFNNYMRREAKRPSATLVAATPASAEPRNWLHFCCSLCFGRSRQSRTFALPCPALPCLSNASAACRRNSVTLTISRNNDAAAQMSQPCPPCPSRLLTLAIASHRLVHHQKLVSPCT